MLSAGSSATRLAVDCTGDGICSQDLCATLGIRLASTIINQAFYRLSLNLCYVCDAPHHLSRSLGLPCTLCNTRRLNPEPRRKRGILALLGRLRDPAPRVNIRATDPLKGR